MAPERNAWAPEGLLTLSGVIWSGVSTSSSSSVLQAPNVAANSSAVSRAAMRGMSNFMGVISSERHVDFGDEVPDRGRRPVGVARTAAVHLGIDARELRPRDAEVPATQYQHCVLGAEKARGIGRQL